MNVIRHHDLFEVDPGQDSPPLTWLPLLLSFLRRRGRMVGLIAAGSASLGAAYLAVATPKFTATAQLLIDTRQGSAFQQQAAAVLDAGADSAMVESQVEVLRADGTARQVVTTLHLADDAEFRGWANHGPWALLHRLAYAGPPDGTAAGDDESRATEMLKAITSVRRIGLSDVIELSVQTPSPARSAQLANALSAAYIGESLEAKAGISRQATLWLQDRLKELRDQSMAADRLLEEQRARIGLVETDKGGMNEQALGDLTLQLGNARARMAEAAARYSRIQAVTAAGLAGSVTDALADTVIVKLQQQYLEDARKLVDWTARLGPQHAAVLNLQREMAGLKASLAGELDRIQESYKSDLDIARGNEAAVQAQVEALVAVSTATNGARAQIRALESLADTYRALYGSFLQRYTQAAQDQSFPIAQARVISQATAPLRRSAPATMLVMLGSLVAGLGAGLTAALATEALDRRIYTAAQLREAAGLECLGLLPRAAGGGRRRRRNAGVSGVLRTVANEPSCGFSDHMRAFRVRVGSAHGRHPAQVIGVTSASRGDGRSTVAANLAQSLAGTGRRTLLIDWDFQNPALSASLTPGSAPGFDAVARREALLDDAVRTDAQTSLCVLPASRTVQPGERFTAAQGRALLDVLKTRFEHVIVDLPPLSAPADAQTAVALMDSVVIVVAWSKTQAQSLIEGLEGVVMEPERLLGAVMNQVDLAALRRFPAARRRAPVPAWVTG